MITYEQITQAAQNVGIHTPVDAAAFARLADFIERRRRWSRTHNLSGPRALQDPWLVDVLDGLALTDCLAPGVPLVDVGAGSGVPGLLVACLDPERQVHLVEPLAKRAAFLRITAVQMQLSGVRVHRARWPAAIEHPQQVVSRAVVDPGEWPALAASAGPQVQHIIRLLADRRPAMTVPGFHLAAERNYSMHGAPRRIERWARTA